MNKVLHITNGDSAAAVMKAVGVSGDILLWQDVLHEGPVPANLSLEDLSDVRARFIIDQGWAPSDIVFQIFQERDKQLKRFQEYDKVILWFEHELYDQLQLRQILDWFAKQGRGDTLIEMICVDQYLGPLSPDEMNALIGTEKPVSTEERMLAQRAGSAFCEDSPENWQNLLKEYTSALPFLEGAVIRLLEEYPSFENGLSRTALQALEIIANGETDPHKIFKLSQNREERMFMGDTPFWKGLDEMIACRSPLVALPESVILTGPLSSEHQLAITEVEKEVLKGAHHWLKIIALDRWLGGVHLTKENMWCWNKAAHQLVKRNALRNGSSSVYEHLPQKYSDGKPSH